MSTLPENGCKNKCYYASEQFEYGCSLSESLLHEGMDKHGKPCPLYDTRQSPEQTAQETLEKIAPFLRRLIEPRADAFETNDYVNGSSDCMKALEAIQEWDEVCKNRSDK